MSGADRLEDGFPHGTPAGYDQGCTGGACPARAEGLLSCVEAKTRFAGDWSYRRRVLAGMTASDIRDEDAAAARLAAEAAKPVRKSMPAKPKVEKRAKAQRAKVRRRTPGLTLEKHGTNAGYQQGCRLRGECPGVQTRGKSCNQASAEYAVLRRARALARMRPEDHGKKSGYENGCRLGDECPAALAGGLSCGSAAWAYEKARKGPKADAS